MPDNIGYLVPHTHWDREWRYPLWESRMQLIQFIEELMDTLESDGEYKSFLLDGQCAPVFDYLAVRPGNEERIKKLIKAGRIFLGPWYTLPDLFPISGESIVRNITRGMSEAEKLGNCLYVGYESFGWGKPSQLPQIYKGVGIETAVIAKHVGKDRAPDSEFLWTGADGTTILATRLGIEARANFFMHAYLKIMTCKEYKSDEYRFRYGEDGLVTHDAGEGVNSDYRKLENLWSVHPEHIGEAVQAAWDAISDTLLKNDRILMHGSDCTTCCPEITRIIRAFNALDTDKKLVMSDLHEYEKIMRAKLPMDKLVNVYGELRDGPAPAVSGNALMTRAPIKILNRSAQNKLFGAAEPLSVCAALLGGTYEKHFLESALDCMLLSHSHDSINGVTQDETVEDTMYRLRQTVQIADTVTNEAQHTIIKQLDTSGYSKDDILLVVFNPLPHARREIVKATIDVPCERAVWDFSIEGPDGSVIPVQHVSREEKCTPVCSQYERPMPFYADRHQFWFDTCTVPAGGLSVYRLVLGDRFDRDAEFWAKTRKSGSEPIASSPTGMENEFLAVTVHGNGTVTILDKESGAVSGALNYLESTGDVGDYWVYYPPYNNRIYTSKGNAAEIWTEENGPLCASICARYDFMLPARAIKPQRHIVGESKRSDEMTAVQVTTRYSLKKGERKLDVELTVGNTAQDHKLSLLFDTSIDTEYADAQGHFCVDRRHRLPARDEEGLYWNEMATAPMQNFCDISDEETGIGIAADCLGEYELRARGVLALTLFRAVRNEICTEWRSASVFPKQRGGQLQEEITYKYAICPHRGDWLAGGLESISGRLNIPLRLVQTGKSSLSQGSIGGTHSFFSISEGLSLSSLRLSEKGDGFICRVFNPGPENVDGLIRLEGMTLAYTTDLRGRETGLLQMSNGCVSATVGSNKILTILFKR